MHELSITKTILQSIVEECETNNIVNPKTVVLELGKLTSYNAESILMYYDLLKKDYPLIKDTELCIEEELGKLLCDDCHTETIVEEAYMLICKNCDSTNIRIIGGKNIIIKEIKI